MIRRRINPLVCGDSNTRFKPLSIPCIPLAADHRAVILAKVLKMDIFTCAVASLANIGGTATAPVLAGAYSSALVPVGIVMALLGYVIGTGGGLLVANLMRLLA